MGEGNIKSSVPLLSVIVALVSDTVTNAYDLSHLDGCLDSLMKQNDPPSTEIIVPYPSNRDFDAFKNKFQHVKFVPIEGLRTFNHRGGSREHHDELRSRGLSIAKGEILALLEDHARPDPNWSNRVVYAHRQDYAGIGGAIENGIDRPVNWAAYFCDFGKYQNPVPEGVTHFASDANISYKRSALLSIRDVWRESFHEMDVNWVLRSHGEKLALSPEMIVYQFRKDLDLRRGLKERFIWGRSYAATRCKSFGNGKRVLFAFFSVFLPLVLLLRLTSNVIRKRRNTWIFIRVIPFTFLFLLIWSLGEFSGYITARAN